MNELKRQLNEKMGDTSKRTASVIQKIEAGKKVKRQTKKKDRKKKKTSEKKIEIKWSDLRCNCKLCDRASVIFFTWAVEW